MGRCIDLLDNVELLPELSPDDLFSNGRPVPLFCWTSPQWITDFCLTLMSPVMFSMGSVTQRRQPTPVDSLNIVGFYMN